MWFLLILFGFNTNFGSAKDTAMFPGMEYQDFDKNIEVWSFSSTAHESYAIFFKNKLRKLTFATDTISDDLGFSVKASFDSACQQFNGWKMTEAIKENDSTESFHSCLESTLCSWKKMFQRGDAVSFVEIIPLRAKNKFIIYSAIEDSAYSGMLGY